VGSNEKAKELLLTSTALPIIKVEFGGHDHNREPIEVDAEEFIGVKSFKAKGKRLSVYKVKEVTVVGSKAVAEESAEGESEESQVVDAEVIDETTDSLDNSAENVAEEAANQPDGEATEPETPYQRSLFDDEDLQ
jgi:topoisomerase-4 subunit A